MYEYCLLVLPFFPYYFFYLLPVLIPVSDFIAFFFLLLLLSSFFLIVAASIFLHFGIRVRIKVIKRQSFVFADMVPPFV